MQKPALLTLFLIFSFIKLSSQNTIGLIDYQPWNNSYDGYNLIYPHNQSSVYLIDNCGRIIQEWKDDEVYRPGNTAYLTEDGHLIKSKKIGSINIPIWTLDGETIIEARDWDNNLLWQWSYLNENSRLHHDFEVTPQGTILAVAWDHYSINEAIEKGRDSVLMQQATFSPDKIVEYDPVMDSIIWEWKAWDHVIQDRHPDKSNYGIISEHPEKIDINWENNMGRADWMHVNAIDYLPDLEQILINVPFFNEMWIIDHSTTTEEAATSAGGLSGKGGDLLWRWGNPITYGNGENTDQKLFFQHDASWVLDFQQKNINKHYGAISIFNNRKKQGYSSIELLAPVFDTASWSYVRALDNTFLPADTYFSWEAGVENFIYSTGLSSVQVLPNDNLLICSGRNGRSIELNQELDIVWNYVTPTRGGEIMTQGTQLQLNDNLTFRIRRYPSDYRGLQARDLSPLNYLELNPNEDFCEKILSTEDSNSSSFRIFPNPIIASCYIQGLQQNDEIHIYDIYGKEVMRQRIISLSENQELDCSSLHSGFYFIRAGDNSQKIIKL